MARWQVDVYMTRLLNGFCNCCLEQPTYKRSITSFSADAAMLLFSCISPHHSVREEAPWHSGRLHLYSHSGRWFKCTDLELRHRQHGSLVPSSPRLFHCPSSLTTVLFPITSSLDWLSLSVAAWLLSRDIKYVKYFDIVYEIMDPRRWCALYFFITAKRNIEEYGRNVN